MKRSEIIRKAKDIDTVNDLVHLLNEIKFDIEGFNKFPVTLENIYYYTKKDIPFETKYQKFVIPKKNGKVRLIYAPIDQLKNIQCYLNVLLQSLYHPKSYVTGFVPGRSIVDNAWPHVRHKYILCLDLKDFFTNVSETDVYNRLINPPFNFKDKIAKVITNLCCVDLIRHAGTWKVLPQGAPTSPILANAVCDTMDEKLYSFAQSKGVTYTRYADDITLSTNTRLWPDINNNSFIHALYMMIPFKINFRKTRVQRIGNRQEITGLIISDKVNVKREFVKSIRNILYIWDKYGFDEANKKFAKYYFANKTYIPDGYTINMPHIIGGKIQYIKMVKGQTDPTFLRLYEKFKSLNDEYQKSHKESVDGNSLNIKEEIIQTDNKIKIIMNSGLVIIGRVISLNLPVSIKILLAGKKLEINFNDIKSLEDIK